MKDQDIVSLMSFFLRKEEKIVVIYTKTNISNWLMKEFKSGFLHV